VIYVPCTDGLHALRVSGNSFSEIWHAGLPWAGPPILSGGVLWTIDTDAVLHGYAADSGAPVTNVDLGSVTHFATPAAGGGRLFAPADTRVVAFGGI